MVSPNAIDKINTGKEKFSLVRKIRECDGTRFRYDHKSYTWDFVFK